MSGLDSPFSHHQVEQYCVRCELECVLRGDIEDRLWAVCLSCGFKRLVES